MSAPFSVTAAAYSLPQEDDIDLASLLITEPIGGADRQKAQYPLTKGSPSFNASRITVGSPNRRAVSAGYPGAQPPHSSDKRHLDKGRTRSDPALDRGLFEGSSDLGSVDQDPHISTAAQSFRATHRPERGPEVSELFLCRESFLVAADFSKSLSDAMLNLERAVDRDGNFNEQMVGNTFPRNYDYRSITGAPKECGVLRDSLIQLASRTSKLLFGLARNQETANRTYHTQLKKMREVCNQSIRTAIQADRAQSGAHMAQMKEMIEVERDRSLSDIKRELGEHQRTAASLKEEVQRLHDLAEEKEAERCLEHRRHEDHVEELEAAHRQALRAQQASWAGEKATLEARCREEVHQAKVAFETSKNQLVNEHNSSVREHRAHDNEIRGMLNAEIDRLKDECSRCRDQLIEVTAQASSEREKLLLRFDDEKKAMESEFQKSQAESVQSLARIRGEVADRVRRIQEEERRRQEVFEEAVQKERGDLLASHILEVESLEEKHRKDTRRLEAQLEVRHSEEMAKLRKVHEHEVKRLITDNDRLHRSLLAKSKVNGASVLGGMQQLKANLDASNNISRRAQSRAYSPSLSGGRVPGSSFSGSVYAAPSPVESVARNGDYSAFSVSDMAPSGNPNAASSAWNRDESPPPPPPKSPHVQKGHPAASPASLSKPSLPKAYNENVDLSLIDSPTSPFASLKEQKSEPEDYGYSDDSNSPTEQHKEQQRHDLKADRINWGSLQESIDMQEGRIKTPSRNKSLPDSFVLEEALQNAQYAGHNVTSTANAVGSYMNRLQDYLEGSDAGDTLSDGSAQRHLNAASGAFFGTYRLNDQSVERRGNDASFSSEDSLQ